MNDEKHGIDVTQALKDTENSLRDFISYVLSDHFGSDWEQKCGVPEDRLKRWKERKETEKERQKSGARDERLIYYADFYDLKTILQKNWKLFSSALGKKTTLEVWLNELGKLRDPDAHRRELLPHQKNLILGLSGEIRTKITRYRSSQETSESYYPRIEFAADNLGNSWKIGDNKEVNTRMILRPGDLLEYVVTASDPLGEPINFQYTIGTPARHNSHRSGWTSKNSYTFEVTDKCVGISFSVEINIISSREYHATAWWDDGVKFIYEVLPPR
jgi:hypothetical protein